MLRFVKRMGAKFLVRLGVAGSLAVLSALAALVGFSNLALVGIAALSGLAAFFGLEAYVSGRRTARGVVGMLDAERLRAADRHRELSNILSNIPSNDLSKKIDKLRSGLKAEMAQQTRDVEALMTLMPRIQPRATLPTNAFSGNFAINPGSIAHLADVIAAKQPSVVLELGSGISSVWMGYLLEQFGGRLITIDHDPFYARLTGEMIVRHELTGTVEVRLAPLVPRPGGEEGSTPWYDHSAFADVEGIDLLVVDGPPQATGLNAREPALSVLRDQLSPRATVILDDAARPEEQEVIASWESLGIGLVRVDEHVSRLAVFNLAEGTR